MEDDDQQPESSGSTFIRFTCKEKIPIVCVMMFLNNCSFYYLSKITILCTLYNLLILNKLILINRNISQITQFFQINLHKSFYSSLFFY